MHQEARDNGPAVCTRAERWQDEAKSEYCVQKIGAKKPWRIKSTMTEAIKLKEGMSKPDTYEIVERENKSEPIRCLLYCNFAHKCEFARQYVESNQ